MTLRSTYSMLSIIFIYICHVIYSLLKWYHFTEKTKKFQNVS